MAPSLVRSGRIAAAAALVVCGLAGSRVGAMATAVERPECVPRVLVLTAMPLELNPLVRAAELDPEQTVRIDDRTFYVGRLAGHDVVLAMTGIGLVNAAQTATTAFEHFRCRFTGVLFSGVAGSQRNIGDVAIPARWTGDYGKTWIPVDAAMLATAGALQGSTVKLSQDVPVGDAACLCPGVAAATPVHLPRPPSVHVGGDGQSDDFYGGHAIPCLPGGGDIAGCKPCITDPGFGEDVAAFARNAPPLFDEDFVEAFLQPPAGPTEGVDAEDQETAPVAEVARTYGVPFLGIRAASDGQGDPLNLPGGWLPQFFAYRQLAGNNAAAVTIAFLEAWAPAG